MLLNLLEVSVLDIVILTTSLLAALSTIEAGISTWLSSLSSLIHLSRSSLHNLVEVVDSRIDSGNVASLMSILELLESRLDTWLLVCRNLITIVLQEVLGGEDHRVSLIHLIYTLTLSLISSSILLSLSLHTLDFLLAQAA